MACNVISTRVSLFPSGPGTRQARVSNQPNVFGGGCKITWRSSDAMSFAGASAACSKDEPSAAPRLVCTKRRRVNWGDIRGGAARENRSGKTPRKDKLLLE